MKLNFYTCIFSVFLVFVCLLGNTQNVYKRLYPEKCDSLIQANSDNPNFVILDVRTDGEWRPDHLEGSINRSTRDSDFEQRLALLPRHKIFLLHCQSGSRSRGAFTIMQNLQFEEVYEMIGGISGWKSAQYATTNILAPQLMLVAQHESDGNEVDTIKIILTNRANDQLVFHSITIGDDHEITHDFNNDIVIEGAEDYSFTLYHSPDYISADTTHILLESNGGTLNLKASVENDLATAIQKLSYDEFKIYPNPATNKLFLKGLGSHKTVDIEIYNVAGQMVFQKSYHSVNSALSVAQIPSGIHIIRISTNESQFTKKLLIKH